MPYKAFISYSHHSDADMAPAIQKGVHRFTKPWYRLRALHLFRDQTNLAVAPGLWPEIVKALEDFSPTSKPVTELQTLAQALSNRRIDAARSIVPLTRDEFEQSWQSATRQADRGSDLPDATSPFPLASVGCP